MDKSDFKVIKGGLPDDVPEPAATERPVVHIRPEFVSAWVTDTRLMGVVAMYIHWRFSVPDVSAEEDDPSGKGAIPEHDAGPGSDGSPSAAMVDAHQFFYFDSVDTGFERFEQVIGNDEKAISSCTASFAGGLGGKNMPLNRQEAVWIFRHYFEMNRRFGYSLPPGEPDYLFMDSLPDRLSETEVRALFRKMCTTPLSINERVNYFMMQVCNLDEECIKFLSNDRLDKSCAPGSDVSTLYKNDITHTNDGYCYTESVVETETGYEIWKSRILIESGAIVSYERTSRLEISDTEAYLTLSHSEFVMVYRLDDNAPEITQDATPLTRHSQIVDDEDGMSYMLFRPNNKHVDTDRYRLYDDIFGVYHITTTGQLICSANTKHDMAMLELDLVFSPFYQNMQLTGNYEFNEPVMAQFLSSGYDDFDAFMEEITSDD